MRPPHDPRARARAQPRIALAAAPAAGRIPVAQVQFIPAVWQTGRAAIGSAMLSRRAQRLWLFGILIWVTLALLSATQNATWRALSGRPVNWLVIVPNSLADWLTCGMFTPAFYWMVRRFPIRGERWWTRLPIHLGASFIFVLLKVSLYTPLYNL